MPVGEVKFENWAGGINNRAPDNRLPEGFVRDLLNLYPVGATLQLRPGADKVYDGTNVRGLFGLGDSIVVVDGSNVLLLGGASPQSLGSVPATGAVCGAELNSELYMCVGGARLIVNPARGLRAWGVDTPADTGSSPGDDPQRTPDQLRKEQGLRKYTLTYTNVDGVESGAPPGERIGASIVVPSPPTGHKVNVYATEPDGSIYYLQGSYASGRTLTLGPTNAGGKMLMDQHVAAPPPGEFMAEVAGVLIVGAGNYVFHTLPMSPHHVDLESGFLQYPEPLGGLVAGVAGLYVSADKCYKIDGVGQADIRQRIVFDYPAIRGSMANTPDGMAVWVTEYGMAAEVSDERGGFVIAEPSKQSFVPAVSSQASSGVVHHNGERLLVANNRKSDESNPLAAAGYFEAEVIRP